MTKVDATGSPVPNATAQNGHHHKVRKHAHAHVPGQIAGGAAQVQTPAAPAAQATAAPSPATDKAPAKADVGAPEMTKTPEGHVSVRA